MKYHIQTLQNVIHQKQNLINRGDNMSRTRAIEVEEALEEYYQEIEIKKEEELIRQLILK